MIKKPKILQVVKKDIPIYYGELIVIVTETFDDALIKYGVPLEDSFDTCWGLAVAGYNAKVDKTRRIILLKPKPSHSVIAHEALHITHGILKDVGIITDYDNDEANCYLLDWIIEQIYTGLTKYKIKVYVKSTD